MHLSTKLLAWKSLARLAQSVERKAFNLVVVGSSPTVGVDISAALLDNLWAALPLAAKSKKNTTVLTRAACSHIFWEEP